MYKLSMSIFLMMVSSSLFAQELEDFRWQNRLLLIFSPNKEADQCKQQLQLLAGKQEGVHDRDLIVFQVFPDGGLVKDKYLTNEKARKLYDQFSLSKDGFHLLLIGKDGGIKLRKNEVTAIQSIFDLIDSMPMMQSEMRRKH